MSVKVSIIGAGPGGYVAAIRAAQLGAEVTVVENDNVGGTCLNWGCIPSKVMIKSALVLEEFRHAAQFGIQVDGTVRLDMARLMARKQKVIQDQTRGIHSLFKHNKIRYLNGHGKIEGSGKLTVSMSDGRTEKVGWDRLILAVGTRPTRIPALPFDGINVLSSNHALNLQRVPASILIVGGGVIGCEFAFMLRALGAQVTVVEALSRMLPVPSVDDDCSKVLQREMKKRKIKFFLNHSVSGVEQTDSGLRVTIDNLSAAESGVPPVSQAGQITVEQVLVCIGRTPNTSDVGLSSIGLETDPRGWIDANDGMQTGVSGVYAIGDVLGPDRVMLAHVASAEGVVAAENALGADQRLGYAAVPGAIFTMPEVATVGLTELQARDQYAGVRADTVMFRNLGKAQVIGDIAGQAKIVSAADSGRVLGVHLIGPHATDLIAEATLALKQGCTVADLAATIHAHPTLPEIMFETSLKAMDRSLHG